MICVNFNSLSVARVLDRTVTEIIDNQIKGWFANRTYNPYISTSFPDIGSFQLFFYEICEVFLL